LIAFILITLFGIIRQ